MLFRSLVFSFLLLFLLGRLLFAYYHFPQVDVSLISSGGGVFEICLDDNLIFSKKSLNRFPDDGEIKDLIMDRQK